MTISSPPSPDHWWCSRCGGWVAPEAINWSSMAHAIKQGGRGFEVEPSRPLDASDRARLAEYDPRCRGIVDDRCGLALVREQHAVQGGGNGDNP